MVGCEDEDLLSIEANRTAKSCDDTFQNYETISPAVNITTLSSPIMADSDTELRIISHSIALVESADDDRTGSLQRGMKRARNEVLNDDVTIAQSRIIRSRRNAMTPNGAHAEIARDVGILLQMETVCFEPSLSPAFTLDGSSSDDVDDAQSESPLDFA